jgi:hypothetical protein
VALEAGVIAAGLVDREVMFGAGEVGGADQPPKNAIEIAQRGLAGPLTGAIRHLHQAGTWLMSLIDQGTAVLRHGSAPVLLLAYPVPAAILFLALSSRYIEN